MVDQSWGKTPKTSPEVVHRALPSGVFGRYNLQTDTIYIDPCLSLGQYRSTLAHELVHAERKDYASGNEWLDQKQEIAVEAEAARRLIQVSELMSAARWCQSLWELADHLVVDEDMLETRIAMLSEEQAAKLKTICEGWWST